MSLLEIDFLKGFHAPIAAASIAGVTTFILTPFVRRMAVQKGAVDDPSRDDRRIHSAPVPRWGGLAIFCGLFAALGILLPLAFQRPFPPYLVGLAIVSALLAVVGALDDLYQFPAKIQAIALLAAGLLIQVFRGPEGRVQIATLGFGLGPQHAINLGYWSIPITAIYIFVVTKTMDTIDGVDGLAAGIASITAIALTVIAFYGDMPRVAIIAAAIAGASLGFLRHNYHPAKIFMGTSGAYVLGFMLAGISIVGALKTAMAVSLLLPWLLFGIPVIDAIIVVVRRLMNRQPITQADKRHIHYALLNRGLSQKQTVWVLYSVAAVLSALAVVVVLRVHGHS